MLRGIKAPANPTVTLLGCKEKLTAKLDGATLTIQLPQLDSEQLPSQPAYAFKIAGGAVLPEPSTKAEAR